MTSSRLRRTTMPAMVVCAVLLATGCGSVATASSTPGASAATADANPGTAYGAAAASTCVPDVGKVIADRPAADSATAALPPDLVGRLDSAAAAAMKVAATPGAIVGVRTPTGTWIKAYGQADPATATPMVPGMHTRVGSITKTFTGTVLMQLQEQGKLSLADTIDKYVPNVPNGTRITLRQLADMTSGVASYTFNEAFIKKLSGAPQTVFTPAQLLAYGISSSPSFEPGAKFEYSNTNTVLLGMVIEKVTGKPVGDAFQQMIIDPLRLTHTVWPGDSTDIPAPYPQGFTLQSAGATPEHPGNATDWNPSWGWTAGEMIMDVHDLLTYDQALATGQGLLGSAAQTQRLTSFPGAAGYGIAMGCIGGWVGHTGELPGYNTSMFYDTTNGTSVVVQTNSDIQSGNCPDSPTLTDDPRTTVCSSPATAIFVPVSRALGHQFVPNPQR